MTDEPLVSVLRDPSSLAPSGRSMCVCVSRYLDRSPVSSTLLFSLLRACPIADKSCCWLQQHLKHSLSLGFGFDDVEASVGDQGRGNDSDEGGANLGLVG